MANIFENHGNAQKEGDIDVKIGARFLDLFSEQLYASPQKAFEELIANGWDAGAKHIDVVIPDDLKSDDAALIVADDGESMDFEGLKKLWSIAVSEKENAPNKYGRPFIGKFGIGKLATYVLANGFTYVCKSADGVIRFVNMNYENTHVNGEDQFVDDIQLQVYKITAEDLSAKLRSIAGGEKAMQFIRKEGLAEASGYEDEYNSEVGSETLPDDAGTWTLVILSNLKEKGKKLSPGRLKNMLRAALPLGSGISIRVNNTPITPKKQDYPVNKSWELGTDKLSFSSVEVETEEGAKEQREVTSSPDGRSVMIEGLGKITGKFTLYDQEISSGKSAERGNSHGFYVNVLGRVINQANNYFGTANMHHGTWARFRCTVRADFLGKYLTISRESLDEGAPEVLIFREFLRRLFNEARNRYLSDEQAVLHGIEDKWVEKLGSYSIVPLRNFVNSALGGENALRRNFLQLPKDSGGPEFLNQWNAGLEDNSGNLIKEVKIAPFPRGEQELVKYDPAANAIILNKDHPFVLEYATGKGEKRLLEALMSAVFMSDIYMFDMGVSDFHIGQVVEYREKMLRVKAIAKRQSCSVVIDLLRESEKDTTDAGIKRYEDAVASAFRCLGFHVELIGGSGQPDGIAHAAVIPGIVRKTEEKRKYSFILDAKATARARAQTANLNIESIGHHRKNYKADYAVIVACGFQTGGTNDTTNLERSLSDRPEFLCLTSDQLIKLLDITAKYGVIPYHEFKELFDRSIGAEVDQWIDAAEDEQQLRSERFSVDGFFTGLKEIEKSGGDDSKIDASTISFVSKKRYPEVKTEYVTSIAKGIQAIAPDYIDVGENDDIRLHVSVDVLKSAVEERIAGMDDKGGEEE